MRADRLVATLLLLQARRRVTAAQVAKELEVSERTARRDLDALAMAGIPVYASRGRGGGWELVGGARTDLSGLTAAETRTLFAVTGPAAAASPELKVALRKLVRALPAPFRHRAEAAAAAVVVDPGAWGSGERPRPAPPHLDVLQQATVDGEQVRLGYTGRDRTASTRTVHPLGLVVKRGTWYLVAGTAEGQRTFRVDRVASVEPTGMPAERPADFDLGEAWERIVAVVDDLRSPTTARAAADPDIVGTLRWAFGKDLHVGDPRQDGRIDVVLTGQCPQALAWRLAGFGAAVLVLDPPETRRHLAEIGDELVGAYRS